MTPPALDRRRFLGRLPAVAFGAGLLPHAARAPGAPRHAGGRAYDLVVSGGRVIDPANGIDAVRDVGITAGRVAAVLERIDPAEAGRVVEATGKLVLPGLIDAHVHVYDGVAQVGVQAEAVGLAKGVTTLIDAGSAGATTFGGFRAYVVEPSRTRVLALLNISRPGMTVPNELADLAWVDPEAAVRTVEAHRDVIVGLKVRMLSGIPGGGDVEVLRRTREGADAAGVPIVMHIGGQTTPLPRLLELLRPGDVVTHALRARGSILDDDGRVFPAIREARARGIRLDVGHGRGNLDFDTAESVLGQGVRPDGISSDVHRGNVAGPVFGLPTTLSKFVLMGMPLAEVVRAATATPAETFGLPLGTLSPGAVADVSVLEEVEGRWELVDSGGKRRTTRRRLVPYVTLAAGRELGSVTG